MASGPLNLYAGPVITCPGAPVAAFSSVTESPEKLATHTWVPSDETALGTLNPQPKTCGPLRAPAGPVPADRGRAEVTANFAALVLVPPAAARAGDAATASPKMTASAPSAEEGRRATPA